ncbi:hypothetical protein UFOVP1329_40 [uncultured Caudovirales phage]|uniref:Uncharacterized protein n=1 Tax=uncultured Caudovirales phage TaxID=2100421 RepID=A0A6J5RQE3_9CAUD|nr:hypothetical protein UFOVP1150_21 [uncultured Caudovirales phage]CAB4199359.1 hypothetical protein UFOVP1329_40 [uncultured Caudovirales phage]CAB4218815.1 hypothetical protein UFOVP1595_40 [uncultured Caudovirales phage]
MDVIFRGVLGGGTIPDGTDAAEGDAILWAAKMVRLLANGDAVQSAESDLEVRMLGMKGTADFAIPSQRVSGDLKSGQIRNYDEQQAAYAIGFMEREFVDEWTTHLLFCDEEVVVTRQWTLASATALIKPIVLKVKTPDALATQNEYCSWCRHRWTCKANTEPLSLLLTGAPDRLNIELIKSDPEKLGALMNLTHAIAKDDGLHDELRKAGLATLIAGTPITGWSMTKGRTSESTSAGYLGENFGNKNLIRDAGTAKVLTVLGSITGKKFRELWAATYGETSTVPEGIIKENHGSAFIAKSKAKAKK